MNYARAFIFYVKDLQEIQSVLVNALEFTVTERNEISCRLENGALCIRLLKSAENTRQILTLDISSSDIAASIAYYQQYGFTQLGGTQWLSATREEVTMQSSVPVCLVIARDYNEDELGVMPPLQTSLEWHDDALLLAQRLIKTIPVGFRDNARHKIIELAEADTIVAGQIEVDQQLAIRAIIKVTPDFQHDALKDEIVNNGLAVKDFFSDE